MKKIIVLALLFLLASFSLFLIACSNKDNEQDKEGTEENLNEVYGEEAFLQTLEESALCYFSLFDRSGFDSYIYAFPDDWRVSFAEFLGIDEEMFCKSVEEGANTLAKSRINDYGDSYVVGFEMVEEETLQADDYSAFVNMMSQDFFVDADKIKEAKRVLYRVVYFEDEEKTNIISSSSVVLTFANIVDEGWKISPENYIDVR